MMRARGHKAFICPGVSASNPALANAQISPALLHCLHPPGN